MKAKVTVTVAQLCPTLCDPLGCSPLGSSVHGILQARMLEWVTISFSRGSFPPRDQARVPTRGRSLTIWATREAPGWVLQTPIIPPAPFVEDTKPHSLKTWSSIHWSHEAPFIEDVKLHSLRGWASKEPMSGMERPKSTYWFTFKQSTTSRVVRATYYEAWLIMWPEY